ncbi:hypothetical protein ILYODFUR_031592, partial [Ilyodon furcidens]
MCWTSKSDIWRLNPRTYRTGSAANTLVPHTTTQLKGSTGVHALTGQAVSRNWSTNSTGLCVTLPQWPHTKMQVTQCAWVLSAFLIHHLFKSHPELFIITCSSHPCQHSTNSATGRYK